MRPRWGDVRQFCKLQGYKSNPGDHDRFLKVLLDRSTSGTMISHGADGETVSPEMWLVVWKHQLRLASEDDFWRGLRGEGIRFAIPYPQAQEQLLPDYLLRFLRDKLHYGSHEIAQCARDQAQDLLDMYYAGQLRKSDEDVEEDDLPES